MQSDNLNPNYTQPQTQRQRQRQKRKETRCKNNRRRYVLTPHIYPTFASTCTLRVRRQQSRSVGGHSCHLRGTKSSSNGDTKDAGAGLGGGTICAFPKSSMSSKGLNDWDTTRCCCGCGGACANGREAVAGTTGAVIARKSAVAPTGAGAGADVIGTPNPLENALGTTATAAGVTAGAAGRGVYGAGTCPSTGAVVACETCAAGRLGPGRGGARTGIGVAAALLAMGAGLGGPATDAGAVAGVLVVVLVVCAGVTDVGRGAGWAGGAPPVPPKWSRSIRRSVLDPRPPGRCGIIGMAFPFMAASACAAALGGTKEGGRGRGGITEPDSAMRGLGLGDTRPDADDDADPPDSCVDGGGGREGPRGDDGGACCDDCPVDDAAGDAAEGGGGRFGGALPVLPDESRDWPGGGGRWGADELDVVLPTLVTLLVDGRCSSALKSTPPHDRRCACAGTPDASSNIIEGGRSVFGDADDGMPFSSPSPSYRLLSSSSSNMISALNPSSRVACSAAAGCRTVTCMGLSPIIIPERLQAACAASADANDTYVVSATRRSATTGPNPSNRCTMSARVTRGSIGRAHTVWSNPPNALIASRRIARRRSSSQVRTAIWKNALTGRWSEDMSSVREYLIMAAGPFHNTRSHHAGVRSFSLVSYTSVNMSYLYVGRKSIGASSNPSNTFPACICVRSWSALSIAVSSFASHSLRTSSPGRSTR
eukprot:Opistho-2@12900